MAFCNLLSGWRHQDVGANNDVKMEFNFKLRSRTCKCFAFVKLCFSIERISQPVYPLPADELAVHDLTDRGPGGRHTQATAPTRVHVPSRFTTRMYWRLSTCSTYTVRVRKVWEQSMSLTVLTRCKLDSEMLQYNTDLVYLQMILVGLRTHIAQATRRKRLGQHDAAWQRLEYKQKYSLP